jgi:transcriptional regulator with XRE-family HTH domain
MDSTARATSAGLRRSRAAPRVAANELGDWIRSKRTDQSVSQRELADRAGISRSYLCDIERGRGTRPSVDCLDGLAAGLGADRTELLRVAGILEPLRDPVEYTSERRLVSVFRGLSGGNQEAVERFARFLLAEEQHWTQARLIDGESDRANELPPAQAGPTLFDLSAH